MSSKDEHHAVTFKLVNSLWVTSQMLKKNICIYTYIPVCVYIYSSTVAYAKDLYVYLHFLAESV